MDAVPQTLHPITTTASLRLRAVVQIERAGRVLQVERKDAGLLALVALSGAAPRSRLALLLWPDVDEARARTNLRQRLSRLRRAAGDVIAEHDGRVMLSPGVQVDTGAQGDAAGGDDLLSAYGYDDCPDFADWLDAQRAARRAARRAELTGRIATLRERDPDQALALAQSLLALDAASEESYRLLMELYYLRGDIGSALKVYGSCREMLGRAYGAAPSAPTEALVEQLRRAGTAPAAAPAPARIPIALLRPPRMVGRDAALAAALGAIDARRTVLVSGEAGIGKSRLMEEIAAAAGRPAHLFRARPDDARQSWGALSRLCGGLTQRFDPVVGDDDRRELTRVLPQLGPMPEPLSSPAELARLHDAVTRLIEGCAARGDGLLLLVDDLQFADASSVNALRAVLRPEAGRRDERVLIALATRLDGGSWQAKDLVAQLDSAADAEAILLQPLPLAHTRDLLREIDPAADRWSRMAESLQQHCGGNPAFLLECLKALVAGGAEPAANGLPIPGSVQAALAQRLAALSDTGRRVVDLAAVAGAAFTLDLAASALALPPLALAPALREIGAAQLMRDQSFVHDLVEEAVLRSVAPPRRRELHLQVAAQLQTAGGAPGLIAHHLRAAGDAAGALPYLQAAAAAAIGSLRPDEAGRLHEEAADVALSMGERAAGVAHLADSFSMYMSTSFIDDANRVFDRWAALAETPAERLRLHARRAQQQCGFCRVDETAQHTQAALAILDAAGDIDEPLLAECAGLLTRPLIDIGLPQQAIALAQRVAGSIKLRDPAVELQYRRGLSGALAGAARFDDAIAELRRAVDLHEAGCEPIAEWDTRMRLANYLVDAGRAADAAAQAQRSIEAGRRQPHFPTTTSTAHLVRAIALGVLGEYREALLYLTSRRDYFRRTGWRSDVGVCCRLAVALLHLGDAEQARAALPPSIDAARVRVPERALYTLVRARIEAAAGRPARPHLEPLRDGRMGPPPVVAVLQADLLQAAELPPANALAAAARIARQAEALALPAMLRGAAVAATHAALALGDAPQAARHAALAVEHALCCCPVTGYLPEAWLAGVRAFDANGQRDNAARCLQAGVDWIDRALAAHVPPEFAPGFRTRNPVNRALLAAAGRAA